MRDGLVVIGLDAVGINTDGTVKPLEGFFVLPFHGMERPDSEGDVMIVRVAVQQAGQRLHGTFESASLRGFQGRIDSLLNLGIDFHLELSGRQAESRNAPLLLMLKCGGVMDALPTTFIPDGGAACAADFGIVLPPA